MSTEAYPIEVAFPDISVHEQSSSGIAYVHTFDSGEPGPHVMINALTHGNEVCGAIVVDELLRRSLRPRRGRLTLAFANVAAYRRFDPANPDAARFVDQDFNRVWTAAALDDTSRTSSELARAREMRPVIDTVDMLLDLHSMHEKCKPLIVAGPLQKGIDLAVRLGTPATVICDEGHPEGRRMRDYEGFGSADSAKNALLIECGQHWERSAVTVARDTTARFLLLDRHDRRGRSAGRLARTVANCPAHRARHAAGRGDQHGLPFRGALYRPGSVSGCRHGDRLVERRSGGHALRQLHAGDAVAAAIAARGYG